MPTNTHAERQGLMDANRMEEAAITAARSGEALFGYLSRLDALRDANLDRQALADRAAHAELQMRMLLSAGMDALNELNDVGLLVLDPTDEEIDNFNNTRITKALARMTEFLREQIPSQRWDWLEAASHFVEGVELRIERREGILRSTITHSGQSTIVDFDPKASHTRVSTEDFFSSGPDRIYVPTSAIFAAAENLSGPISSYDAAVGAMAFAREWVYRHARNAAELGSPERIGGGPVIAVIAVVLTVLAAAAAIVAAVAGIICAAGSDGACRLAGYVSILGAVLTGSAKYATDKANQMQYGTNNQ